MTFLVIDLLNRPCLNFLAETKFNFVKSRKLYYAISTLFIVGGMISMGMRGLDYGVEFTGGRSYTVEFKEPAKYNEIQRTLGDLFVEGERKITPEVKMIENKYNAKITTNYMINSDEKNADSLVEAIMLKGLAKFGVVETDIKSSRKIDPVISTTFKRSAIVSVILSVVIMFLYIMIRFRKWQYGLGTAVALIHDVLFVIGMYSMLHGIMPFTMEVDQAFIAAILTIMGYSINDTVVVFDRIREYMRGGRKDPQDVLINDALNSTLSRTVNNSITIFVVLFAIFFFGPESIKGFTFTLMVGVVVGTYSSICVATPILIDFATKKKVVDKR
ncbi:MAG: protein translocase subunit SecF [Flavobacteriales bacterium]